MSYFGDYPEMGPVGDFRRVQDRDFTTSLQTGKSNQDAMMGALSAGIEARTEARRIEAMERALARREQSQSRGGGFLGALGSIGSSFLGPIGGALGKSLFG